MAAAVGVAAGAIAALNKITDITRQTQIFQATLETATGSVEGSAIAFEALNEFAAETPYTLDQSIDGFVKLTNLGLNPSREAMMSYGDTASALGKDMMDMVEAVADAVSGENERLKEFGIKASVNGDRVRYTFKGITTEIGNNAAEIEKYLISLGQDSFGGAMIKRMDTLDGKISNLSMVWDDLFRTVGEGDAGGLITDGVVLATDAIETLTDMLRSGELGELVDANLSRFSGIATGAADSITIISDLIDKTFGVSAADNLKGGVIDTLSSAFFDFPENVQAAIQLATVEVASFHQKVFAYGDSIAIALNPFSDEKSTLDSDIARIDETYAESVTSILQRRDVAIAAFGDEVAEIKELSAAAREEEALNKSGQGDVLAQFKFQKPKDNTPKIDKKAAAKSLKSYQKLIVDANATELEAEIAHYGKLKSVVSGALENRVIDLATYNSDSERLSTDHQAKLAEIQFNTKYGMSRDDLEEQVADLRSGLGVEAAVLSDHYSDLNQLASDARSADVISFSEYQQTKAQLAADFRAESLDLQIQDEFGVTSDQALLAVEGLQQKYATETELLQVSLEEQSFLVEAAFVSEQITAQERNTLLENLESDHQNAMHGITMQGWQSRANIATGILGNIQQAMAGGSKKEFDISKKASIATAAIKGGEAAVSSFAAGAKVGGPILGGAFAAASLLATTKQISNIQKQSFGGGVSSSGGVGSVSSAGVGGANNSSGGFSGGQIASAQQTESKPRGQTIINMNGMKISGMSESTVEEFAGHLAKLMSDNDVVLFGEGTAQAEALRA